MATTIHSVIARRRTLGVGLSLATIRTHIIIAILCDIATHVVYAELICCLAAHNMGDIATIFIVPPNGTKVVAAAILIPFAQLSSTGSILPLRLSGEPETLPREVGECNAEILAVVPRHVFHWILQVAGVTAGVVAHHGLPQFLCDLGLPNHVGAECHLVSGKFLGPGITALLGSAAHGESAAFDDYHRERHAVDGECLGLHGGMKRVNTGKWNQCKQNRHEE